MAFQVTTILIEEGGSDELVEELKKLMEQAGWKCGGYNLAIMREKGDGKTPCPQFHRQK